MCIFLEQGAVGLGQGHLWCHLWELWMFPAVAGGLGFGDNQLFLLRTRGQGSPFPAQQRGVVLGLPWLPVACVAAGWTSALLWGATAMSHLEEVGMRDGGPHCLWAGLELAMGVLPSGRVTEV